MVKKILLSIAIFTVVLTIIACDEDTSKLQDPVEFDDTPYFLEYGNFPPPQLPEDNKLTIQKVKLGKMLFYEKMLSRDGSQSCASCHSQATAFTDTMRFSIGIKGQPGLRQAMPVFNMAWHSNEFFWDGRAHLLRDQSLKPIQDPLEMDETLENAVTKISNSKLYRDQFIRAFGTAEVSSEKIGLAMEQFMLTILSIDSKYDRYLAGIEELSESEKRGMILFETEYNPFFPEASGADCAHCHGGINFENDQYMNNGLDEESRIDDQGRQGVTQNPKDKGKFKVPSLRNVSITPPYMHDGRFKTLEEVIDHYDNGIKESSSLDPALRNTMSTGLKLSPQDKQDLINFLKTLTDYSLGTELEYSSPFK